MEQATKPKAGKKRTAAAELRIGTSGWFYTGWWGDFYPPEVKKKDALLYYATRFGSTELNGPFYRSPTPKAVEAWYDTTPDDFRFTWKGARFITHRKRLLVDDYSLELLEARVALLREKLGPILFQLPPQMKIDAERLATFIGRLNRKRRYTFEFRHDSWYTQEIFDLLAKHDMALCISDHDAAPAPREVTASWVYIRNHGPSGHYYGNYSDEALGDWATAIRKWRGEGRDVWCFFDNDMKTAAPHDADRLCALTND